MSEATARTWEATKGNNIISGANIIASCAAPDAEHHAASIARDHNAHDALVEALEEVEAWLKPEYESRREVYTDDEPLQAILRRVINSVRAALEGARG